jgi:hypothetical protein
LNIYALKSKTTEIYHETCSKEKLQLTIHIDEHWRKSNSQERQIKEETLKKYRQFGESQMQTDRCADKGQPAKSPEGEEDR